MPPTVAVGCVPVIVDPGPVAVAELPAPPNEFVFDVLAPGRPPEFPTLAWLPFAPSVPPLLQPIAPTAHATLANRTNRDRLFRPWTRRRIRPSFRLPARDFGAAKALTRPSPRLCNLRTGR